MGRDSEGGEVVGGRGGEGWGQVGVVVWWRGGCGAHDDFVIEPEDHWHWVFCSKAVQVDLPSCHFCGSLVLNCRVGHLFSYK